MSFHFKILTKPSSAFVVLLFLLFSSPNCSWSIAESPNCNQSILGSENCKKIVMMQYFSKLSSSSFSFFFTLSFSSHFLLKICMGRCFVFFCFFVFLFSKKHDFFSQNFFKTSLDLLKHQNETLILKWKHNIKTKPNPNPNFELYTCVVWSRCYVMFVWLLLFLWVFALYSIDEKINILFFFFINFE